MSDRIGTQLGNYRLVRLLGSGITAEVYLGEHIYLKRLAALKVFNSRLFKEDAERFVREAQMLSHLNHINIVRVLDFAVYNHQPFLVMEYASSGTLRTLHPQGSCVPLENVVVYVRQVALALQYAHEHGLIHLDVKPENMLLSPEGEILLSDFGIAIFAPVAAPFQGQNEAPRGTTAYMAPEQLQGRPLPASDQYALAIILYEWLCGRRPFEGTPREVALQQLAAAPTPLRTWIPNLPQAIEDLVLRALAKDPQQRFASMPDFADAFAQSAEATLSLASTVSSTKREVAVSLQPIVSAVTIQEQIAVEPVTDPHLTKDAATNDDNQPTFSPDVPALERFWKVPAVFTSLIGREREIDDICAFLTSPEVRLLTLLGVGGIGKTRLSIAAASALRTTFTDGICFVGLAGISDSVLVMATVALELGLADTHKSFEELVQDALHEKHFLLILDNFEQVVEAAAVLEQLVATCPQLKILVTSRVVLRLPMEQQFRVPALAIPDIKQLPEREAIAQYASVELFVQRARALLPAFQVTDINAAVLAEICVWLDGIPLAIELAAARIKLLPPQELLPRLSKSLAILTKGMTTQPTRQQTLRNTISWSYDLLDSWEQRLFRLCSVFVDGFTLQAIEAVYAVLYEKKHADTIESALDGVDSLIDNSLLQPPGQEDEESESRLVMLETVREYGRERLAENDEMEAARGAHAAWYLQFAEEASKVPDAAKQTRWIKRLERNYDNLRAAMAWMLEEEVEEQSTLRVEMALRLGIVLERFWSVQGYISEGWSFMKRALAKCERVKPEIRAQSFSTGSVLVGYLGDHQQAETLLEQSLALSKELGDTQRSAYCLRNLGWMAHVKGNFTRARSLYEESLGLFRVLDDKQGIVLALMNLGYLAQNQGDYESAYLLFLEAVAKSRELGNTHHLLSLLFQLAQLLYVSREHPPANEIHLLLAENIALAQEVGDRRAIVNARFLLGCLALRQGELTKARLLLEEASSFYKNSGDQRSAGSMIATLGRINAADGQYVVARSQFEESLTLGRKQDDRETISYSLIGLGILATAQKQYVWAARLWGADEKLREVDSVFIYPVDRPEYDEAVASVRGFLGQETFTSLWAEGRALSLDEVLAVRATLPPTQTVPLAKPVSREKTAPYPSGLSAREVEVLRLVAQGLSDAEVAEHLVISPRTVNAHLTSIYNKLAVNSRAAATRFAVEHHLA